ncbi:MATE family efflux transporter [Anaerosalibacter bizertensis]|uniref:MATE family efflux transporter n=1 Tax=Anaerosalibacter bizertensis TaxID=932217 RepID=A0A9Q4AC98_9FIRM|nr:MATE family efflux transporter [Anaerosalibacter bizertensis]MBV1817527.1 MATE family efflux transporter [Bacteroidales bacterium MSK.15.36]MCB5559453.1 MATE family efflux transporter [Anaerosalibacter bizertensis]MCG4565077.1 MATE family efflux transporter [Anaerosalibacter bizertensis]MCG4582361.1 MATE family efflux transporter [Anaerosalibacter bizertensis]MCG4585659.1 MATE family efflux transporter [Anaerosalibacter bizertensis]
MKKLFRDKEFFLTILTLVIPITLQNLISSSLNMVDNLMIGKLGENAIAAVGLVNQYFFIFMLCLSGINAGAGIFMSQFWGRKDTLNIRRMLGLDLILSIIASIIFSFAAFIFPEGIMKIFTKDTTVIGLGSQYLRIIGITFIFTGITQGYSTALRCTGIAKPPMFASLIGVLVNGFLNWILIFGHFGFKPMGVVGAAIATSIARFIEMLFVLVYSYGFNDIISAKLKEMISFSNDFVKVYFKTSLSVIINEIVWALGMTAYSVIYAKIGISAVASMQIATTINNMFMVLCIGLATAASIIIGNKIGADEEDVAIEYATKLGVLAPLVGLVTGIALWITSPIIVKAFNISEETLNITVTVLKIMAVFAPLRFFNVLMIVGVFRGGGDTMYSMLVQLGTVWCFAIPAGFIAAAYFKLPLNKVYFIICLEEVIKIGFEAKRLRSKKWIRNVVEDEYIIA